MNLIFRLALLIMDKWSVSSAELVNMLCGKGTYYRNKLQDAWESASRSKSTI
ncbi:hypothetical protein QWY93_13465 [Echinicola jeungdonensis]|uniref:hypothetical protein n=1 Tax=Echinicola jeungdonensis TaxID=709343 RepID=UPI0025B2815A|nr:hypothetical protein [Echinicola jeungdonensis]MDN3670331.1 hypothetical protein [Echinicola jeungdonensis]